MKKKSIVLFSMFLLVAACAPKEGIEIRDAWIRSAPQGGNSALYFVIHNYSADVYHPFYLHILLLISL